MNGNRGEFVGIVGWKSAGRCSVRQRQSRGYRRTDSQFSDRQPERIT